jgi:VCBS repeat-containing protein
VASGTVTVSLAGGATISSGANGSSTLTLSGTQAQINAALASLSYQGNLNFNGSETLTVLSTDSNGATDSDSVAITVASVNDGPMNTVPGAQTVNEDTALSISGVSVNDVDGNLTTTQLTVGNGAVTVSLAGGATISAGANGSSTLTLSGTQAQINAALASLSYQGNSNFNGSDTLTVLSTDANGATDSDTVAITVSSVNDGPVNVVPGAQTVNEDTSLSIGGVSVNDVDGNLATTQLTVGNGAVTVSLAGGATISAGANGSSTLTLSGTQAQINAALASLSYQGNSNFNGSDTLTVLSTDGNGMTDSDTVSITVSSVNDGPVNTVPGAQTVNEDTALSISGVSVNDVDGNLSTTQLTVTNGAVTVSLAGGATISAGANGSSTLTLSGTQAQINAALASIGYQGNADFNGSETLTVLSTDANGATDSDAVSITVSSVNDGPVNTVPGAQTVNEDTSLSISGVSVNDVDGNLSTTQLTVTSGTVTVSLAGGATISAGANGSSTLTLSGTQAQINAALASLSYQGNAEFSGADTLTVLSTDANGSTDADAVAITVNAVNDGPLNTVPGAQTVNEDTSLSIGGVSVNDVDGNLSTTQLTVTNGAINVSLAGGATISAGANGSSSLTLSGTQAQINAALASLSYQGNPNFNGSDTLTVLSTDANGATDSDAVAITVSSVNDGPVNTVPGAQTVNEDTALPIGGIAVTDVDGNLSTTRLTVTNGSVTVSLAGGATISAGANGSSTLTLSGTQAQINAALASISYQGNADFNGADTLTVLSTDANGATDSDAVSIAVSSVNDGPVNTVPGVQTVNEDTALPIGGISVNDADGNLSTTQLTVANGALNVSLAGGATISAGANGSSTLTLSGTQAQINAALASLSYQGNANFNGSDTLTVLSTDGNGVTDSDAISITVSSVNDGPVNTVPGALTVNEDTSLPIGGVSVNDVDGNLSSTRLTVASGTLNVSLAGGATISAGANGSSTLTLSGTQAQINAALGSISYQGNADFAGSDTLTVLSTDANGATDSDAISITVTAVNDAPAVTSAATATFVEDATGAVYTATRSEVDGGDTVTWTLSGADAALFTIDPVTGVVSLTSAQDFDTPGDANADGVYEITVRATDSGGLFDQRNVQLTLTDAVVIPPAPPLVPADEPANPMAGQSAPPPPFPTAPASQPVLPDFAPRAPQPADRPLGLPVDAATPASNLGAVGLPGAASPAAPAIADLNALPPTGAGPAATFGLVRLSVLDAGSHLRQTGAILQHDAGGHHLFVYHGVPDMRLLADNSAVLRVPGDAFAHTDPAARVYLEARLANGAPLPGWLKFDGLRGVFSGTPPEGVDGTLEVEVVARDTEGREARTKFALEIEELRAQAAAAGLALGLDVDKEEAEKVRQELARQAHRTHMAEQAKAATAGVRPAKPGAASFSDQVNAAKTQRDPLLDRISPSGKDKAGTRR